MVRSTRLLKLNPKTAIKISNRFVERIFIIAKFFLLGKANTKIVRDFEPPLGRARSARKSPKSMGGAVRRPRNVWSKNGKSNSGVYLRFRSNLFYQKFLKKSKRSAPPPLADSRLTAKKFSSLFMILRPPDFFLKGNENFFAVFCSDRAGRWGFASARGQKLEGVGGRKFLPTWSRLKINYRCLKY